MQKPPKTTLKQSIFELAQINYSGMNILSTDRGQHLRYHINKRRRSGFFPIDGGNEQRSNPRRRSLQKNNNKKLWQYDLHRYFVLMHLFRYKKDFEK